MLLERVLAAQLAQHYFGLGHAHVLGIDYLIRLAVGQHAMLMYARLMQKCVLAHYGLIGLYLNAGQRRNQLTGAGELAGVKAYIAAVELAARL